MFNHVLRQVTTGLIDRLIDPQQQCQHLFRPRLDILLPGGTFQFSEMVGITQGMKTGSVLVVGFPVVVTQDPRRP
jgi:hypothetical protein